MLSSSAQSYQRLTPKTPIKLIPGFKALLRLGRDYEDTSAVFEVYRYLNGTSFDALVERFSQTAISQKLRADPHYVMRPLSDTEMLRALPSGSLGGVYLQELEAEGLDPAAVQNAAMSAFDERSPLSGLSVEYPEFYNLFLMLNWTHDLVHTLTGYGRDPLGEIAIHQFMHAQGTGNGNGWMARLGGLSLLRAHAPLFVSKVMRHAQSMGRQAHNLSLIDWVPLLDQPLDAVRHELRIIPDQNYGSYIADNHRKASAKTGTSS